MLEGDGLILPELYIQWGVQYVDARKVDMSGSKTVTIGVTSESSADHAVKNKIPSGDSDHRNSEHHKVWRYLSDWSDA